ncbi:P-loop containing nucleoside triphosphate hydrolase protein [Sistotremastrum niveocremeum HHB9708]|uniref:p-loop containing nucleoside triphosphate hydrolase protein n=1 Tax=Sistotremastrum niveocremeum HHB9708 TaxID=1314777 RepID=A0A164VT39_9AGAM|nr:P-loop containing nucleoside triphosphate hydrolase protein [Sistotremastrum niveocremeum HHB9708]
MRGYLSASSSIPWNVQSRGLSIGASSAHGLFSSTARHGLLFSAREPSQIESIHRRPPEVIFSGRANVGKSSLINSCLGRSSKNSLVKSSKTPGKTRSLDFFHVGYEPVRLVLVDSPGFGFRGKEEWGQLFDAYISTRQELRRIYLLINGSHGVKPTDRTMLEMLGQKQQASAGSGFTIQAVITKIDGMFGDKSSERLQKLRQDIFEAAPTCLPPILTSTKLKIGIDELRRSMTEAAGI